MIGVDMINQPKEAIVARHQCRVAILFAPSDPAHLTIAHRLYQLFLQPMAEETDYEPVFWTTYFSEDAIRARAKAIIAKQFDLVLAIGETCSQNLKQVYAEHGFELPTIYMGILRPHETGLVSSLERCGNNSVAIVADEFCEKEFTQHVVRFKQYVRRIVIPYAQGDSACLAEEKFHSTRVILELAGFEVKTKLIQSPSEGVAFIKEHITTTDMVIIFEGSFLIAHIPELAVLCWENSVLFFAGAGEEAINLGAACVYGGSMGLLADRAYELVSECTQNNTSLGDLPVIQLEYRRTLVVNEAVALQCGLPRLFIDELKKQSGIMVWRRWVNKPA
jgi:ABC-type uncharacterized transport system substrate-binding protein